MWCTKSVRRQGARQSSQRLARKWKPQADDGDDDNVLSQISFTLCICETVWSCADSYVLRSDTGRMRNLCCAAYALFRLTRFSDSCTPRCYRRASVFLSPGFLFIFYSTVPALPLPLFLSSHLHNYVSFFGGSVYVRLIFPSPPASVPG